MTTRSQRRRALGGIVSALAVLAAVLLAGSPARAASSNYLSGPAYGESLAWYCGPTAVQIALARGGASSVPSQHTLALETDTYHNPADPGMPSVQAAVPVLNERLNTNFYYYWPRDNATEAYGDFRKNLVHSIDMGYPVVVNIKVEPNDVRPPNYPVRTTSIYHYVTVVGYTDDGYTAIVADPAGQGGADGVLPDDWNNVAREWSWPSALLWDMLWTGYAAGIAPASMGEPEYDDYIPGGNPGGGGGGVNMPSPGSSNSATLSDFSGDGDADILARNAGTKDLHLYQGNGAGGFQTGAGGIAGNNWSAFDTVITAGDFSGDGAVDVIARHATSKDLYLYEGDGFGGFATGTGTLIGNNWAAFDMILAPGDFTGDGKVDILARNATTKALHLYRGNGTGGFQSSTGAVISSGWGNFDQIVAAGDFSGDGKPDLIARHATTKDLHLYHGNGTGGFQTGTGNVIGNNWAGFDMILSTGDFSGDGKADLLARHATTKALHLYRGNGAGGFQSGTGAAISSGWGNFDLIF